VFFQEICQSATISFRLSVFIDKRRPLSRGRKDLPFGKDTAAANVQSITPVFVDQKEVHVRVIPLVGGELRLA